MARPEDARLRPGWFASVRVGRAGSVRLARVLPGSRASHPGPAGIIAGQGASIPSQASADDRNPGGEGGGSRVLGGGGLLLELVLPVTVCAALLLVMASYTSRWDLRTPLGLGAFGVLLVALSLFVSLRLDAFTLERRRLDGKRRLLNRADPRSRLVKFVLGGVVIPAAALTAANRIELPGHQTPMTVAERAVRARLARPEASRAAQLGRAVLRAPSPVARVQGIEALRGMGSVEALDQLFQILSQDPGALGDRGEYQALSAALASYGPQARLKLQQRFSDVPPEVRRIAAAPPGDVLQPGSGEGSPVPGRERELPAAVSSALPSFILQTFLQMDVKQDAELLSFARQTAADGGWSPAVRGQALLLIAKLGDADDLDGLYAYLESPDALLQAWAMRAISALQAKLSAAPSKG